MMTHRERVEAAINHQEPDRIPIDLWGSASRMCNELYFEIVRKEGWAEYGRKVEVSRVGDYLDYRIADLIDCDFRHPVIGKPKYFKSYVNDDGFIMSEWGHGSKVVGHEKVVAYHPLADAEISDIAKHSWPLIQDPGRIEGLEQQVRDWYENTDYFIAPTTAVSGLMIDIGPFMRGFEKFFMDLYFDKKFAHTLIGTLTDLISELYTYYLSPMGACVGWVEFSSDHGMQDRPIVSPEKYREFFKEPYARLFRAAREAAPKAKIWMHSCGSVRELIPDFIEMGVDILNSLQPRAAGMDSFELKREFGSEIVFHGGLDIQGGVNGTRQEAVEEAKLRIDAFAPGGGYIFAPSNHFIADVSAENFFAIYETAREYGVYPLRGEKARTGS
jgi:uroporphyrinogen decarboxylase